MKINKRQFANIINSERYKESDDYKEQQRLKRNHEILKQVPSITIDLGDGQKIRIAPSMGFELDWKFVLDGTNNTYYSTNDLWVECIQRIGNKGLWKKRPDMKYIK